MSFFFLITHIQFKIISVEAKPQMTIFPLRHFDTHFEFHVEYKQSRVLIRVIYVFSSTHVAA